MRKHDDATREKALGALYASAIVVGDGLQPAYRAVAKTLGIATTTLRRWWEARDPSRDALLRIAHARAKEAALEEGAREWGRSMAHYLRRRAEDLIADDIRFKAADFDRAARGLQYLGDLVGKVDALLSEDGAEPGDGEAGADPLDERVREALERPDPPGPAAGPPGPLPD